MAVSTLLKSTLQLEDQIINYVKKEIPFIRASQDDKLVLPLSSYFKGFGITSPEFEAIESFVEIKQPFSIVQQKSLFPIESKRLLLSDDKYGALVVSHDDLKFEMITIFQNGKLNRTLSLAADSTELPKGSTVVNMKCQGATIALNLSYQTPLKQNSNSNEGDDQNPDGVYLFCSVLYKKEEELHQALKVYYSPASLIDFTQANSVVLLDETKFNIKHTIPIKSVYAQKSASSAGIIVYQIDTAETDPADPASTAITYLAIDLSPNEQPSETETETE